MTYNESDDKSDLEKEVEQLKKDMARLYSLMEKIAAMIKPE